MMNSKINIKVPFWGKNCIFYIYSLLLGMFGGLGFYCFINFIFSNASEHPISYPAYLSLGFLALLVCFLFIGLYCSYYSYIKKKLQAILHLLTVVAGFVIGLPFSGLMDKVLRTVLEPLVK
ncbi:MAG: hypothetical protein IKK01_09045 [Clostridia bacterium]|nr:hypothetical protein [Clostridia bacterium]